MNKKQIEEIYFERFVEMCPELAGVTIVPGEAPDFICRMASRVIGVEVTRLFHGAEKGRFAPIAVHSFREKITEQASRLYNDEPRGPVGIGVLFEDTPLEDQHAVASKLAGLVAKFVDELTGDFVIGAEDESSLSPEFLQIRVVRGPGFWTVSEAQMAPHLTPDLMQAAIDAKSSLESSYRAKVDETWLLLVIDRNPLAGSLSVKAESLGATYATPFDRIYLLLSMEGELHPLTISRSR